MFKLTDDLIFAEGGRRYCFVHPDDPNKCIKTLNPNGDPQKRKNEAVWYKKLRPLAMFDDNKRELKSFQELAKKGDGVWNHFPRCYGIQSTNRGDGIITDLIRNEDGGIPLTVRQYVKEKGKTDELLLALEEFFSFLRENNIITRDILDHNIIVREHIEDSSQQEDPSDLTLNPLKLDTPPLTPKSLNLKTAPALRVLMIDGFGSSEVLPFSQWIKLVGRKKVARKIERCKKRYGFKFSDGWS